MRLAKDGKDLIDLLKDCFPMGLSKVIECEFLSYIDDSNMNLVISSILDKVFDKITYNLSNNTNALKFSFDGLDIRVTFYRFHHVINSTETDELIQYQIYFTTKQGFIGSYEYSIIGDKILETLQLSDESLDFLGNLKAVSYALSTLHRLSDIGSKHYIPDEITN